jgi:transcriptional regulator with XRE-family HTH domain
LQRSSKERLKLSLICQLENSRSQLQLAQPGGVMVVQSDCAEVYKKTKATRILKGWTQDDTAQKLGVAVSSYAKIERGETDVCASRLAQIAQVFEMKLSQLLEMNEHTAFNVLLENHTNYGHHQNNIYLTETKCAHELEKKELLLIERDKEIENLKKQIAQLEEINRLKNSA